MHRKFFSVLLIREIRHFSVIPKIMLFPFLPLEHAIMVCSRTSPLLLTITCNCIYTWAFLMLNTMVIPHPIHAFFTSFAKLAHSSHCRIMCPRSFLLLTEQPTLHRLIFLNLLIFQVNVTHLIHSHPPIPSYQSMGFLCNTLLGFFSFSKWKHGFPRTSPARSAHVSITRG